MKSFDFSGNRSGRPAAALIALCLVTAAFGQSFQQSFDRARELLKQRQFSEALEESRRAIHLDPSRWEGWFAAGTAAVGLAKYDLATDYFEEALPRAPESGKSVVEQGLTAARQAPPVSPRPPDAPPAVSAMPPQPDAAPEVPAFEATATHIHPGLFDCNYCDQGQMTVTAAGIQFTGSVHRFQWKREDIVEVRRFLATVQIRVKDDKVPHSFFACSATPGTNRCRNIPAAKLTEEIRDALYGPALQDGKVFRRR